MLYCLYYQAYISKKDTWFLTATLRSHEHVCFDRTLNAETGLFEFLVPEAYESLFIEIMQSYEKMGIIQQLIKLPNRLLTEEL